MENYLTKEQILKAFEKIDPLLTSEEMSLSEKITDLETRLAQEKQERKQLARDIEEIFSEPQFITDDLTTKSHHNWKSMWLSLNADYQTLKSSIDETKQLYQKATSALLTQIENNTTQISILKGNSQPDLSFNEVLSTERQLLNSLIAIREAKSKIIQDKITKQVTERLLCIVCRETKMNVLLMPCTHICICSICLPNMRTCPICRADIHTFEIIRLK